MTTKQSPEEICASILQVLALAERLKFEMRHSWLSNGRQESVAEHTWNMALMAMLTHSYLDTPVDICRTLKMILIHDLVEAVAGDIPFFEKSARQDSKVEQERAAMKQIQKLLPAPSSEEIPDLWEEFEALQTNEAKFAKALDSIEVQVQHNFAKLDSWQPIEYELVYTKTGKHAEHDSFLKTLANSVISQAELKFTEAGIDAASIKSFIASK